MTFVLEALPNNLAEVDKSSRKSTKEEKVVRIEIYDQGREQGAKLLGGLRTLDVGQVAGIDSGKPIMTRLPVLCVQQR